MQTPTKSYPKIKECSTVVDLTKYKNRRAQARYYWAMKKCSALELSKYCGITHSQAGRWVLAFVKERNKI